MFDNIRANQALQVIAFVCVPLLLLLIVFIIKLVRRSPATAAFPTFAVTVSRVGRGEAYVVYRARNADIEFNAELTRSKKLFAPRIVVQVPSEMSEETVRDVVPNLASGLAKLRFQYVIYRKTEERMISEEERRAAIANLLKLGFKIKDSENLGQVQRAVSDSWSPLPGDKAEAKISQVRDLMRKARGIHETFDVLASSDTGRGSLQS